MVPKFRCWFKNSGIQAAHMVEWDKLKEFVGLGRLFDDSKKSTLFTLMQSTGLKGYMSDSHEDDEEKDDYRGDIIDIFWEEWPMGYYQENHMIGVVDKDETGTAWIIKDAKYAFDTPKPIPSEIDGISVSMSLPDAEDLEEIFLHNFNLTSSDITILGNVYENPELLEKADES
ncbi:hypothetical protein [Enterococcus casseliflavus]|uniref:hypothetical protein n=1 Tax=Enterococcus casseliflavus TaxID=37734 RepID=UPI0035E1DBFA